MFTLLQYFNSDFNNTLSVHQPHVLRREDGTTVSVIFKLHLDVKAHSKFLSYFIHDPKPVEICEYLISVHGTDNSACVIEKSIGVSFGYYNDTPVKVGSLTYSKVVYFFVDHKLSTDEKRKLQDRGQLKGILVKIRDHDYLESKNSSITPHAFLSHDSRDKDSVARPLAEKLRARMKVVWYDEYSLKLGDPLRESIEKGLKECKKCILILSPSFIDNKGWTKIEFNSIFHRELIEDKKLVLPIWHRIEKKDVFDYCPNLVDRFAVNWNSGIDKVVEKIIEVLD